MLVVFSAAGMAAFAASAKEPSAAPGINRSFEAPDVEEWVGRFERGGREVFDRRMDIVSAMALRPGMIVADIGAGTGLFARLFSPAVAPEGKVYAVDVAKNFVEAIQAAAKRQGMKNIQGIVNTPTDTLLPPASVDIAFVCDTYHHFEHPKQMLASIRRALKPNGALVVVDYERIPGQSSAWVMEHVRAGKETTVQEIEAAGFRLTEDRAIMKTNYYLRFVKLP